MFSYDRTSKTRQLLCFQGREDRLQILYFSRATSSSVIEKTLLLQSGPMTHNGHCDSLMQNPKRLYSSNVDEGVLIQSERVS